MAGGCSHVAVAAAGDVDSASPAATGADACSDEMLTMLLAPGAWCAAAGAATAGSRWAARAGGAAAAPELPVEAAHTAMTERANTMVALGMDVAPCRV